MHIEHDFAKPPQPVFAHLAEHENLAEVFDAKITRLHDGEDGERNGVGSVRQLQIGPLPPFEETVTEFVPNERIVYRITKGSPLRGHVGVMTFTPAPPAERASSTTSVSPRPSRASRCSCAPRSPARSPGRFHKVERDA